MESSLSSGKHIMKVCPDTNALPSPGLQALRCTFNYVHKNSYSPNADLKHQGLVNNYSVSQYKCPLKFRQSKLKTIHEAVHPTGLNSDTHPSSTINATRTQNRKQALFCPLTSKHRKRDQLVSRSPMVVTESWALQHFSQVLYKYCMSCSFRRNL